MANKKVSIWLHCKSAKGWRYCRPVYGKNNKIKPGYAWVDGAEQHFPEAQYCLYYQETSGKRVWEKVTKNAVLAVEMAERRQAYMQAKAAGVPVQDNTEIPVMFTYTLAPYLEEYKLTNRIESYNLMRQTLYEFRDFVKKNIINQIIRLDLLRYKQWCIETRKNKPRTAANKMLRCNQYIRKVLGQKPRGGACHREGRQVRRVGASRVQRHGVGEVLQGMQRRQVPHGGVQDSVDERTEEAGA